MLPSFFLADCKNCSKSFSAVDRDVTTFRFPRMQTMMTSFPKWLSSFILMYFSVYNVSSFKVLFIFSHTSQWWLFVVIFGKISNDLCEGFTPRYVFRYAFLNIAVCTSVERRKATGIFLFVLKLMFHWLWYNVSAHCFCRFVLWSSSEHAYASFSWQLNVLIW